MKPRKAKDLRELSVVDLTQLLTDSEETLVKQKIQHSLKQLNDTAYLKVLRQDIARIKTILNAKQAS